MKYFILIFSLLVALPVYAQSLSGNLPITVNSPPPPPPPPPSGGACTVSLSPPTVGPVPAGMSCDAGLSDEFSLNSIDTSKWQTSFLPGGKIPCTSNNPANPAGCSNFSAANVVENNGLLRLITTQASDGSFNVGAAISRFDLPPAPSFTEIRAKMDPNRAGGIWFFGDNATTGGGDIVEIDWVGNEPKCSAGISNCYPIAYFFCWNPANFSAGNQGEAACGGSQTAQTLGPNSGVDLTSDFHVYGFQRAGGGVLNYYLDGNLKTSISGATGYYDNQPAQFQFGAQAEFGGNSCNPSCPNEWEFDYVRVYHP